MTAKDKLVCIPEIGSIVRLEEDWTFALYAEYRNRTMVEILRGPRPNKWDFGVEYGKPIDFVTLEAGTEFRVDRVYIRSGLADFSSITFVVQKSQDERFFGPGKGKNKNTKVLKKARFWAKLADVNMAKMLVVKDAAGDETQEEENDDA